MSSVRSGSVGARREDPVYPSRRRRGLALQDAAALRRIVLVRPPDDDQMSEAVEQLHGGAVRLEDVDADPSVGSGDPTNRAQYIAAIVEALGRRSDSRIPNARGLRHADEAALGRLGGVSGSGARNCRREVTADAIVPTYRVSLHRETCRWTRCDPATVLGRPPNPTRCIRRAFARSGGRCPVG